MDSLLFSLFKLELKKENVIRKTLEKTTKIIIDFKFECYNSKDENEVFFINKFGPIVIESILELKTKNQEIKYMAISILEYFLNNFIAHNNFVNPEFNRLWKTLVSIFSSYYPVYNSINEIEEDNKYWVITNMTLYNTY